jgi:hypothetical protein
MSEIEIKSFEDFWPHYVGAHRDPRCRALHYVGTGLGIASFATGVVTLNPIPIALAPVFGYGLAWVGHFMVEGNKPAAFDYWWYSLLGDMKMLGLAVQGKMADEVTRLYGSPAPAKDAPLLAAQ